MTDKFESGQLEIGSNIKSHVDDEGNEVIDEIELEEISLVDEPLEEFGEASQHGKELTEAFNDGFKQCMEQLGIKEMPKYRIGKTVYVTGFLGRNDSKYRYIECKITGKNYYENGEFWYNTTEQISEGGIVCRSFSEKEIFQTKQEAEEKTKEDQRLLDEKNQTTLQKKLGTERYEAAKKEKIPTILGIPADELSKEDLIVAMQLNGISLDIN